MAPGRRAGGRRIHGRSPREDVERELAFHLEMRTRELVEAGWEETAARAEAQRLFGDVTAIRGECTALAARHRRATRRSRMWQELVQDVRYAARWLMREPGFALVAILTLALGIGANTAAFGVVRGVLLAPLPYPEAARLVAVREVSERGGELNVAWPNYQDWRARAQRITLAAHTQASPTPVLGGVEAVRAAASLVSGDFFEVLGVSPALGRGFVAEELVPGGRPAVVVSDAFWRTQLGGERELSRLSLNIYGSVAQVVGVMPRDFSYPAGTAVWLPVELLSAGLVSRTAHNFEVTGRLAAGATVASAQSELTAIMRGIREREADVLVDAVAVHDLREHTVGDARRALLIMLAASGFVLLVACTNLASALLARTARRTRELAVRASLGAPRLRLLRQLLTESLLLAVLGAAAGLLLAHLLLDGIRVVAPEALPRLADVRLDGWVLGFTTLIAVATALLFGTVPALRATATPPYAALSESGRGTESPRQRRVWSVLVGVEVALALVLLVGAGLLIRSFWNVLSVDPGFDADGVLAVTVSLPETKFQGEARVRYFDRALQEASRVPGVQSAALTRTPPLVGWDPGGTFHIEGGGEQSTGNAQYRVVSPDFFATMRIPLRRGRTFTDADRAGSLEVIVINERLAQQYFPDTDPLGVRIVTGGMDRQGQGVSATVIGVVGDVHGSLTGSPSAAYYLPYAQRWERVGNATLVVRTAGRASAAAGSLHARIRGLDADVPIEIATLRTQLGASVADRRFTLFVLGGFAGIALLLAAVGIYGVVAFAVAQRTREIGIRVALGAETARVIWVVSRATMASVAAGVMVGLAGALVLSRLVTSLLFELDAVDPVTFGAVALLLVGVAWVAVLVPAHRATRISPVSALRAE
jgi:putative ABC transport system permease protein